MPESPGLPNRRSFLRKASAAAGAAWVAPTVLSSTPAGAQASGALILGADVVCESATSFTVNIDFAPGALGMAYDVLLSSGFSWCNDFGVVVATVGGPTEAPSYSGFGGETSATVHLIDSSCTVIESFGPVSFACGAPAPGAPAPDASPGDADVGIEVDGRTGRVVTTRTD